jgi:acyl-CoA synthetase (NDP forming)/GNAT superfamily N-acetyltransferase
MPNTGVDVVRSDGGLAHVRPAEQRDRQALLRVFERSSDRSIYYRFFSMSRSAIADNVDRLLGTSEFDGHALVAMVGDVVVGVAQYDLVNPTMAEFAVMVDDPDQHEGIGTLLLEHLASLARSQGIRWFVADVLAENASMTGVVRALGFSASWERDGSVSRVTVDLEPTSRTVDLIDNRERLADAASMRAILSPRSVVVIGASTRAMSVGHEVLRNILGGGFTGDVYAVNPKHTSVLGVPSFASAADLPIAPDLAIVAVPASSVLDVVRSCGERGIRAVLLLTAGFGETGATGRVLQEQLLATVRSLGMRLVGPNCVGVVNTDPTVKLNATFAPIPMESGGLAVASQSGALGIAVLEAAHDCGLGISQFVSVGNKADVSGNDLLLAWEQDPQTSVIALYLESFGNARKFAHIARRVSKSKPIIAIKAGRSPAGQRAGMSHTAAAAASDDVVDALFAQAGVLRVNRMDEMLDVARVLVDQPLPGGANVAIIGNSGGPEILAADAAQSAGLNVVILSEATRQALLRAVPSAASTANPTDLGAAAQPGEVGEALRILLAAEEVDAVLAVFTDTLVADPDAVMAAIATAAVGATKPLVATRVGVRAYSLPIPDSTRALPVFTFPEPAAAALGYAYRYAEMRRAPLGAAERPRTSVIAARELVTRRLAQGVSWLGAEDIHELLRGCSISMCPQRVVSNARDAVRAAASLGYPVVAKVASGVVHKTDIGGVRLGIRNDAELLAAVSDIQAIAGSDVLIQPTIDTGTELIGGVVQDPQFGPVIMFGVGGVLSDLIADRQFRLAPLSAVDADAMIAGLRTAPLLDGYRGRPVVSRPGLRQLLLRLSALAQEIPEVAELDLNPIVCHGEQLIAVDAKVRIAPAPTAHDDLLRELRR